MKKTDEGQSFLRRWWKEVIAAVGVGLLTVVTDWVKTLVEGAASMLGGLWGWCWQPCGLPNAIALISLAVVVAAVWPSLVRLVRRTGEQPTLEFDGGFYFGRLWTWFYRPSLGDRPTHVMPLCESDGAMLQQNFQRSVGEQTVYVCPDCMQEIVVTQRDLDRVAGLAERDLSTGEWRSRHEQFESMRKRLAGQSKVAPTAAPKGR